MVEGEGCAAHVCIMPMRSDGIFVPDERMLEAFAPLP